MAGNLKAEADASNNITATYIWGGNRLLIKQLADGTQYYYLYNGHGDVVQITDNAGNIVNSYEYDEWGNITSQTETIENEFKYAGQTYDSETGLYYLRARYYDPETGRFISKDSNEGSIVNPLSLNLYTYCVNNPLIYIDPSGHYATVIGAGIGTVICPGVGTLIGATIGAAVTVGIIYYAAEHKKGARGSTWDKHSGKRSGAPEKKDDKMKDRSNKNRKNKK